MLPDKIQFRPGDLAGAIAERATEMRPVGATARTMAERYLEVVHRSLPVLAPEEWRLVVDACQGLGDLGSTSIDRWRADAEDAIRHRGAAQLHGVTDPDSLLSRLQRLTPAECLAVLDLAERHWAAVGRGGEYPLPGEGVCA